MRWGKNIKECLPGKEKRNMALQADKTRQSPLCSFLKISRKVFLWILKKREGRYRKASLTVEAAVAVPVFLLAVGSILGILDIYRMQSLIKTSLHQSAMELGMYAYEGKGDSSMGSGISSAFCMAYTRSKMPDFGKQVKFSYGETVFKNNELILRVQAEYKLPVSLAFVPPIRFTNEAKVNCWVGWDKTKDMANGDAQWEEMVYISEHESVYHTSPSCTHIELSIHKEFAEDLDGQRNAYGEKYHSCEKCGGDGGTGIIYYTEKGNRYHSSEHCSGLKRTVYLVKKSEVSHMHQCQRCSGKE